MTKQFNPDELKEVMQLPKFIKDTGKNYLNQAMPAIQKTYEKLCTVYPGQVPIFPYSTYYITKPYFSDVNQFNLESLMLMNMSWIAACVERNSEYVAATPLHLYSKVKTNKYNSRSLSKSEKSYINKSTTNSSRANADDVVEILEHPFLDLINSYHLGLSWYEITKLTVQQLDLVGNSVWSITTGRYDIPTSITVVQPQDVTLMTHPFEGVYMFRYVIGAAVVYIPIEEAIWFKFPNPAQPYSFGISPLLRSLASAEKISAIDQFSLSTLKNHGRPGVVIKVPPQVKKEEKERIEQTWWDKFGGIFKNNKPAVLPNDVDLEFVEQMKLDEGLLSHGREARKELLANFCVPEQLIETTQSRAELEAAFPMYLRQAIIPRLRLLEGIINSRILPLFDPEGNLFVAYENVIPDDDITDTNILTAQVKSGIITPSEARAELGREPIEGGDKLIFVAGSDVIELESGRLLGQTAPDVTPEPSKQKPPKTTEPTKEDTTEDASAIDEGGE